MADDAWNHLHVGPFHELGSCRDAVISQPAGTARQGGSLSRNIAALVLAEVWALRQRLSDKFFRRGGWRKGNAECHRIALAGFPPGLRPAMRRQPFLHQSFRQLFVGFFSFPRAPRPDSAIRFLIVILIALAFFD